MSEFDFVEFLAVFIETCRIRHDIFGFLVHNFWIFKGQKANPGSVQ